MEERPVRAANIFGAIVCVCFAVLNFTQPLWVDDTPVYPPVLGVVLFGPLCLLGAFAFWSAR